MKKTARSAALAVVTAVATAVLSACSGGVLPPENGPRSNPGSTSAGSSSDSPATPGATATPGTTPSSATPDTTPSTGGTAEVTPGGNASTVSFVDTYRNDALDVAVSRIRRDRLGQNATAHGVDKGSAIQILSIRVTNKTNAPLAVPDAATMTYSAHEHRAAAVHAKHLLGLTGTIAAGQTKTGHYGFAVPKGQLHDTTLSLRFAHQQAPVVFSGSLDYSPRNGTRFNDPTGSKADQLAITTQIERSIDAAPPGSTIRIAHYSFDITRSADKLVAAHHRGVHVQMIVDQHNQIVTKQTTTMMELLGTRTDRKSFIVRCRASCMSNHASAMHAKFYLFSSVGSSRQVAMVSSANLTHTNSQGSWNDIQTIVGDTTLYDSLKKYFVDMVPDKNRPDYYRTTTSGPFTVYFFPRASQRRVVLLEALDQVACSGAATGYGDSEGHTVVRVMMYSWRGPRIDIAKKLWSLHDQGCDVQIILNSGRTDLAIKRVLTKRSDKHGVIQVRDAWVDRNGNNVAERYMHEKGITVSGVWSGRPDTKVVYSGSQNFAPASTTDNNELILRHLDDATYDAYAENFRYIREHGTRPLW